jgi:hypothetical protein
MGKGENTMKTYNKYLTEQAQLQSSRAALPVYKVRMPLEDEIVIRYENSSEFFARPTPTELAESGYLEAEDLVGDDSLDPGYGELEAAWETITDMGGEHPDYGSDR